MDDKIRQEDNNQERLKEECRQRNRQSEEYIQQPYGNSIGPRRRSHLEVRGSQLYLVED